MSSRRDDEIPAVCADCVAGEILIVDDNRVIRDGLASMLSAEGYTVRLAKDGEDALESFAAKRPDLVLLDVMMPNGDGFAVCRAIRRVDRVLPIVFLSAMDEDESKTRAFDLGADDYVSKAEPDSLLIVRLRRALERPREIISAARAGLPTTIAVQDTEVDLTTLAVSSAGKTVSRLTKTEADILKLLDSSRGRCVGSDDIISALRGEGFACEDSMLYVHISNLRRKLGRAGKSVLTVCGVGYLLK